MTCRNQTVQVDTVAPAAPHSLAVAGGEDWRRDNGFDLTWENPAQAHAPIVGATVVLTKSGSASQSTYYPGNSLTSIEDVEVPSFGDWTAAVYLRDAAGNETQANASSAAPAVRRD